MALSDKQKSDLYSSFVSDFNLFFEDENIITKALRSNIFQIIILHLQGVQDPYSFFTEDDGITEKVKLLIKDLIKDCLNPNLSLNSKYFTDNNIDNDQHKATENDITSYFLEIVQDLLNKVDHAFLQCDRNEVKCFDLAKKFQDEWNNEENEKEKEHKKEEKKSNSISRFGFLSSKKIIYGALATTFLAAGVTTYFSKKNN
jgi:hypothetical protein